MLSTACLPSPPINLCTAGKCTHNVPKEEGGAHHIHRNNTVSKIQHARRTEQRSRQRKTGKEQWGGEGMGSAMRCSNSQHQELEKNFLGKIGMPVHPRVFLWSVSYIAQTARRGVFAPVAIAGPLEVVGIQKRWNDKKIKQTHNQPNTNTHTHIPDHLRCDRDKPKPRNPAGTHDHQNQNLTLQPFEAATSTTSSQRHLRSLGGRSRGLRGLSLRRFRIR